MALRVRLTTRLTAFFLGALALVLVGFSVTIYLVARSGLSRQADERLSAALSTLMAGVETDASGLEWEPNNRLLALEQVPEAEVVGWTVQDEQGRLIDRSSNLSIPRLLGQVPPLDRTGGRTFPRARLDGRLWRIEQKRLDVAKPGSASSAPAKAPQSTIVLTAALCLEPMEETLRHLRRLLSAVSLGVWLLAASLGRAFCQRALRPLAGMAETARSMGASAFDHRLPSPGTGDELQELADSFNGLLDRLHEAFQRQTQFTGDASHQLRTPLAAMLGQIDVALRRERSGVDYRKTLELVRERVTHLGSIVEALLFLSRADADAKLPDCQTLDLFVWVRDHLQHWSDHPRSSDISLVPSSNSTQPVLIRAHPQLLGQLLDNLLDNACNHTEPSTPIQVRIGLRAKGGGTHAFLAVEDAGRGIAAEDLPYIFQPFFRSSHARLHRRPGVGLGLSIARRIATSLEGSLDVASFPEEGSVFTLTLPLLLFENPQGTFSQEREAHEVPIHGSSSL
ncbi:MAG: hypothetical protein NVSMB9_21120 [Isosphaeraceae bacterium]